MRNPIVCFLCCLFLNACGGAETVNNAPANPAPSAKAGVNQNVAVQSLVALDGSNSTGASGNLITYSWNISSKPTGSTAALSNTSAVNPTFLADLPGTYIISLVVSDGSLSGAASTVTVTATVPNSIPIANAGTDQNVRSGQLLTLDGSKSIDADNDALGYLWSFTSKPAGSNAVLSDSRAIKPAFTPDVDGDYIIRLIVNDGKADSSQSVITVKSVTDPTLLFSSKSSKNVVNINGYVQAGSQYNSYVANVSNETFTLTKYEFTSGGTVIFSTSSDSLGNNQLVAGQAIGYTTTLSLSKQDLGFVAKYYFIDPVTSTAFVVSVAF